MYLLWTGLCLMSMILVYLYIPETRCLPIEEIGALFGDDVIAYLASDGHGLVEAGAKSGLEYIENDGLADET